MVNSARTTEKTIGENTKKKPTKISKCYFNEGYDESKRVSIILL